jgi:hypothetical protein
VERTRTPIYSEARGWEQDWINFFKANCNALFQTALLLTADALTAETALAKSIEELNISSPPGQPSLGAWERAVVMRSIEMPQVSSPEVDGTAPSMLQPGLLPLIQLERSPRICFVLRILLGYTSAVCAQMLGTDESGVRIFFQMAVIQLQQKVAASGRSDWC